MASQGSSGGAIWLKDGSEKRSEVQRMFAQIAPRYDLLNSLLSLRLHHRWRAHAVSRLQLNPGDFALDVCCGTGDFLSPLRRAVGDSGRVVGIDFCQPMLERAREKQGSSQLALGDACCLPIQTATFDAATVGWGIRNVPDIDAAHRELVRVLKPGGRFVSLDMAVPRTALARSLSGFVSKAVIPRLGALFGSREAYTYLPKSTERFLSREQLVDSMERAGLVACGYQDLMMGNVCMHWGRKP